MTGQEERGEESKGPVKVELEGVWKHQGIK